MKKILFTALALSLSLSAKNIYTVDELVLKALENSPNLAISHANYQASKSRLDLANSSYLPKVDLSLSAGEFGRSNTPFFPNDMVDDSLLKGEISLRQLIYDFGKTGGNSDSFKYDSKSFLNENQQQISDKKRDVKSAYYDVLNSLALIEVNKENVKLNESQLYRSQKYFEAGIRTKIDVSDAKYESIKSKLDLKKSEYDLELSYASLDKAIGFKGLENDYKVYYKKLVLNNLFSTISEYDLSLIESINFAYENRYEIKKHLSNINSSKSKEDLANSEYFPGIYFNANYIKQNADELEAQIPENQWSASLNVDWNIYQGGSTNAKTQESKIKTNISELQLQDIKLSIKKEVTQAYINVNKAKDSVELSQSLLSVSAEKFDQAGKRYVNGLSDYIELQQARQGYIDAMSSLVVDYYTYYTSIAILDNSIGK